MNDESALLAYMPINYTDHAIRLPSHHYYLITLKSRKEDIFQMDLKTNAGIVQQVFKNSKLS